MIRIFISSTFSDMQNEREWLHREVYPEVRSYGMKRGVPVDICDLRWGIHVDVKENDRDREQQYQDEIRRIMEVCLWEVENCDPYIVALIGNRHGTSPDLKTQHRIAEIWRDKHSDDLPKEEIWKHWSLTQWELEYSFLTRENPKVRALCMFREGDQGETEDTEEKRNALKDLKDRIIRKTTGNESSISVGRYTNNNKDDFEKNIIESIESFIDEKAKDIGSKTPADIAFAEADAYAEEKNMKFFGREKAINEFNSFINEHEHTVLGYYGASGMGKSSLMAHLYNDLTIHDAERTPFNKCFIACGGGDYSNDYMDVLRQIIFAIEKHLDGKAARYRKDIFSIETAETALRTLLHGCSVRTWGEESTLVLFLDAIDKITGTTNNRILDIFQEWPNPIVRLVCTQIQPYERGNRRTLKACEIKELDREEIAGIMKRKLFSDYHINEQDSLKDNPAIQAAADKRNAGIPLYLDLIILTLKMRMKDIRESSTRDQQLADWIREMPEKIEDLCWRTMQEAINEYLELDENEISNIQQAIDLIAVSRQGLRDIELENIIGSDRWRPANFSALRQYLFTYFRQLGNGTWVFEHDLIRHSIRMYLDKQKQGAEKALKMMYSYIVSEDCRDIELMAREGLRLSARYQDVSNGVEILQKTGNSGSYAYQNIVRTTTANALEEILMGSDGKAWFDTMIEVDPYSVMKGLSGLMELDGSDDYDRQCPGREATQRFMEITGLQSEETLWKYIGLDPGEENAPLLDTKAFEKGKSLATLCTEYCNVSEGMGKHGEIKEHLRFALSFWLETLDKYRSRFDDEKDREELRRIAKHINALFFTNNKNLNVTRKALQEIREEERKERKLSNAVLSVIEGKTVRGEVSEIRALYDSNTGQYHNAMGHIKKALEYHFKSLQEKAELLFAHEEELDDKSKYSHIFEEKLETDFKDICKHGPDGIDEEEHRSFWENHAKKQLKEHIGTRSDGKPSRSLQEKWKVIGVSYRTILQDYVDADGGTPGYQEGIEIACKYARISDQILDDDIVGTIRERLITKIRYAQALARVKDDNLSFAAEEMCRIAEQVVTEYRAHFHEIGAQEGKNMINNLGEKNGMLKRIAEMEEYRKHAEIMRRYTEELESIVDILEYDRRTHTEKK